MAEYVDGGSGAYRPRPTPPPPPPPPPPKPPAEPERVERPPQQTAPPPPSPSEVIAARTGADTAAQQQARLQAQVGAQQGRELYRGGEAAVPFGATDTSRDVARRSLEMFAAQAGLPPTEQTRFADDWSRRTDLTLRRFEATGARDWTPEEIAAARTAGYTTLTLSERNQPDMVADLQRRQQQFGASAQTYEQTQDAARMQRVGIVQQRATEVMAGLPPGAEGETLGQFLEQNHAALAAPVLAQYLELRGDDSRTLTGSALTNEVGMAMGITPNNVPATPEQQRAFDAGTHEFFTGEARTAIQPVADAIREVGGDNARVTALPIVLSSAETGLVQVPLFRVAAADGNGDRFVDNVGRTYENMQDWRDNNRLPPGTISYAENGHLTPDATGRPRMVTEASHAVPDTFWEKAQPWVDGAITVAGVVAAGAVIVGTGGLAAPVVLGGAALYGAGRATVTLHDRATHGQTLSPTDGEARMAWLELGASALGAAGIGASLRAATLATRGAATATNAARLATTLNVAGQYADTGAMVDQTATLAVNWDRLTPEQRLRQVGQIAFWGTMTGAQARQAGGVSNLYGAANINSFMQQTGQQLRSSDFMARARQQFQNLNPLNYEMRQVQMPDGQTFNMVVRRDPQPGDNAMQMSGTGGSGGTATSYNPTTRSDADLQTDLNPATRPGETTAQAAERVRYAQGEIEVRRTYRVYEGLGDHAPRINIAANDATYATAGAHTLDRHGPSIPLNRSGAPAGVGTLEGRIYGDAPWGHPENFSYRWSDESTMNRTVNNYIQANWEQIRSDLALDSDGVHRAVFDAGHVVGEGFYNSGQMGTGPRQAVYGKTSYVSVTIELVRGTPPSFFVVTAFPSGRGY